MAFSAETKKNITLAVVSSAISLVFFLVIIEVYFDKQYEQWKEGYTTNGDWYGGLTTVSDNPRLKWEYRPNLSSNSPGIPEISINEYGFRDELLIPESKPDHTRRISFIGDSVTLGLHVSGEETFVSLLNSEINRRQKDDAVQALNHGIDGYNTLQIFELLKTRVLPFEADKVIYMLCLNDFDFEESSGDKMRYFNKPDSFVFEFLVKVYRRLAGVEFHQWHFNKNKERVFATISNLQQLLLEKNIDFEVVIVPIFRFENSERDFSRYPLRPMHQAINTFLGDQGIDHVDLLDSFEQEQKSPHEFAVDVWHPNARGNQLIAEQLMDAVLSP